MKTHTREQAGRAIAVRLGSARSEEERATLADSLSLDEDLALMAYMTARRQRSRGPLGDAR